MPNPTPDVDAEMQTVFLAAKSNAEMAGHGGTAYCWGLQAVVELLNERDDRAGQVIRRIDFLRRSTGDGAYAVETAAREYGVDL